MGIEASSSQPDAQAESPEQVSAREAEQADRRRQPPAETRTRGEYARDIQDKPDGQSREDSAPEQAQEATESQPNDASSTDTRTEQNSQAQSEDQTSQAPRPRDGSADGGGNSHTDAQSAKESSGGAASDTPRTSESPKEHLDDHHVTEDADHTTDRPQVPPRDSPRRDTDDGSITKEEPTGPHHAEVSGPDADAESPDRGEKPVTEPETVGDLDSGKVEHDEDSAKTVRHMDATINHPDSPEAERSADEQHTEEQAPQQDEPAAHAFSGDVHGEPGDHPPKDERGDTDAVSGEDRNGRTTAETGPERSQDAETTWPPPDSDVQRVRALYRDYVADMTAAESKSGRDQGINLVGSKPDKSPGDTSDLPPSGDQLLEMESSKKSRFEGLLNEAEKEETLDNLHDVLDEDGTTVQKWLSTRPPEGHPEQPVPVSPRQITSSIPEHGIDGGNAAAAVMVAGIVTIHMVRWIDGKLRHRKDDHHVGNR